MQAFEAKFKMYLKKIIAQNKEWEQVLSAQIASLTKRLGHLEAQRQSELDDHFKEEKLQQTLPCDVLSTYRQSPPSFVPIQGFAKSEQMPKFIQSISSASKR